MKENVAEITPGSMVEVRLVDKKKIRGRLGEVSEEGFTIQTAKGNKIEKQKIAFQDRNPLRPWNTGKQARLD